MYNPDKSEEIIKTINKYLLKTDSRFYAIPDQETGHRNRTKRVQTSSS